jgi:tetratricopeptide (TPR) repeat protein
MSEEHIEKLLQDTDRAAGPPLFGQIRAADLRHRLRRRRLVRLGMPAATAAVLLLGFGTWTLHSRPGVPTSPPPDRIAALQEQVRQLQAQTDAALQLVHEVLAQERQQQRLAALEAELASISDPREEIERQVDKTAFTLLFEADRLYRELNETESAVEAYEQVIRLFPQNRWANVARQRLAEIKKVQINKSETEGDSKCGSQSV